MATAFRDERSGALMQTNATPGSLQRATREETMPQADDEYISYGQLQDWTSETSEGMIQSARRTTTLQGRRISLIASIMNVMNAIMGSGILALPRVMASVGWAIFIAIQVAMMIIVDLSLNLLVQSCRMRGKFTYEDLGYEAFGKWGKRMVCITILVQNIGAILSYLIVLGDLLPSLVREQSHAPTSSTGDCLPLWQQRWFLMLLLTSIVITPISLSPKIGFLGYASFMSFMAMVLLAVLTVVVRLMRSSCAVYADYLHAECVAINHAPAGILPNRLQQNACNGKNRTVSHTHPDSYYLRGGCAESNPSPLLLVCVPHGIPPSTIGFERGR